MRCRNGLHEIDASDPWYKKPWVVKSKRKCRDCHRARVSRNDLTYARTPKGRAVRQEANEARMFVGSMYVGYFSLKACTREFREAAQTHLLDKADAFRAKQAQEWAAFNERLDEECAERWAKA